MSGQINWVFHVFFMAFFMVLSGVLLWRGRQHRLRWSRFASQQNFIFQEKGGQRHTEYLGHFRLLGRSVVNEPTEMLAGNWRDRDLLAFNWFFQSSTDFSALRAGFICLIVPLKRKRERFLTFDRSLNAFTDPSGESQLVLAEDDFAARYGVYCKNRKAADELISPAMVAFLLEAPQWLEVDEHRLLLAWQGAYEPDDLKRAFERLERVLVIMGEMAQPASDKFPRKV